MERQVTTTYQIDKKTCQTMIDGCLNNICSRCGRELVPIETVNNAGEPTFWQGCMHGGDVGNFHGGTTQEIYDLAEKLICNGERPNPHYNKYEYAKTAEEREYWFEQQMNTMCDLIGRIEGAKTATVEKTKEDFLTDPRGW